MQGTPCGITNERGRDCPRRAPIGSPLNLCASHLDQAAKLWADRRNIEPESRVRERCPQCNAMALVASGISMTVECRMCSYMADLLPGDVPQREPRIEAGDPVVYYIQFAGRIKIGTTTSLESRLAQLPHDKVLAVERGDRDVEKQRHAQFQHLRLSRRGEWFSAGGDLLRHIQRIADATS